MTALGALYPDSRYPKKLYLFHTDLKLYLLNALMTVIQQFRNKCCNLNLICT